MTDPWAGSPAAGPPEPPPAPAGTPHPVAAGWTPPPPAAAPPTSPASLPSSSASLPASSARLSAGAAIALSLVGVLVLGGLFSGVVALRGDELRPSGPSAAGPSVGEGAGEGLGEGAEGAGAPALPGPLDAPLADASPLPGETAPLGSVWAAPDGFWEVTYDDLQTRLEVLDDGAGSDCGDVLLSVATPAGCTSWSSARLRAGGGEVEVDAYLLALDGRASAAATAARDDAAGVEVVASGSGEVLRTLVLQVGDSPFVLYATVRSVAPGGDDEQRQQHATDALRATALLATEPVVARSLGG